MREGQLRARLQYASALFIITLVAHSSPQEDGCMKPARKGARTSTTNAS